MSTAAATGRPSPLPLWVALGTLLPIELLLLCAYGHLAALLGDGRWWRHFGGRTNPVWLLAIAVVTPALVLDGGRWRSRLAALRDEARKPRLSWPLLAGHALALLLFAELCRASWEGHVIDQPYADGWVVLWAVAGLLTLLTWAAVALPGLRAALVLLLCGVAALAAGIYTARLWYPLSRSTLVLVHALLAVPFPHAVCDPDRLVVGTPSFSVQVAQGCSGYEGIGLIWVFLAFQLWTQRDTLRFPRALLLLPLGTAAVWLANAVRIAALVGVGHWWSPKVAITGFHSQAGWLAFNVVALGLLVVARRSRFFARPPAPAAPAETRRVPPTAAYLAPFLTAVAAAMVTAALGTGFDRLYFVRVIAAAGVLYALRRGYALAGRPSREAVALGAVVFPIWLALVPAAPGSNEAAASALAALPHPWRLAWLVFRVVGAVVTVPLAEELAFRGYLLRRLVAADFEAVSPRRFTWVAILASSVLFGVLHGSALAGTVAGVAYALAYRHRGRLIDAVAAHATTNALLSGYVLVTGQYGLWA